MSLASKVASGAALKSIAGSAGKAISAAYGTLAGIGKAVGTLAGAAGSAADAASKEKAIPGDSNIIYVNFGMAGSAGKQKISGAGTFPVKKNDVKPQVSEKMPTEALLDTAIKYLTSIDKSLKSQMQLETANLLQQTRDEKEAIIEEKKPSFDFNDIKDRFSGLKSNIKENAAFAAKLAKYALGIGAAASLIVGALDQKEFDALKQNIDEFKKSYGWLAELADAVGAGGLMGFLFGGPGIKGRLKAGLVGMVAGHILERISPYIFGQDTKIDPETGEPIQESRSMSGLEMGLSVAAAVMAARYGFKKAKKVKVANSKMSNLKGAAGRSAYQTMAATRKGETWLASKRGRKFLAILYKKLGKALFGKVVKHIGRIVAMVLLGATGVGAIPAIVGILLSVAFIGFDLFDIANAIWDAWKESKETSESATDAVKVSGSAPSTGIISKSESGSPEQAQAFFESRGWTKEQAAGIVGNIAVESGFNPNANGDGGNAWGLAQWNQKVSPDRVANFERVMNTPLRGSTFQQQLEFIDWELKNTEKAAGNLLRNATTAEEAARIVDSEYERSDGTAIDRRISNANAVMSGDYSKVSTSGASGYSGGTSGSSFGDALKGAAGASLEQVGKLFGAVGGAIVKPGIARENMSSPSDESKRINQDSMKLQNDITFGIKKEQTKDNITTPTLPGVSPVGSTSIPKSISNMDPNFKNIDIVMKYLSHFRLAA